MPEEVALFDLAVDTPQCWEAQRQRIAEVAARAREGKTHAVSQT
ncbi:elements of external origin (plasmid) [blood disease bacterium A2-HR MARDI]|uniref:Elements of external origin n=1 Tax=blood disease bacterium A2-HR MARDI TaxID=1944648 RepID=A0A1U9VP62_9RALS|nr:elements of external origin [blood disease bacterium A2-HR MARDI]